MGAVPLALGRITLEQSTTAKRKERISHDPGVPSMGGAALLVLLAMVLLIFGAKRVPELGRSLGRGITEFRKGASEKADNSNELRKPRLKDDRWPRENEEKERMRRA
jgi:sec-independent protein translocase protein TatA